MSYFGIILPTIILATNLKGYVKLFNKLSLLEHAALIIAVMLVMSIAGRLV